jgi:hypothetical protein
MNRYLTVYAVLEALALAALLALSTGCAAPTGPFAAMSEGSRLADGGGECGAVAIDAHHALTAAHCAGAGMEYFAPGESEGRPVRAVYTNKRLDIACVEVETGETGRAIGDLFEGAELTAEANVSGVVTGRQLDGRAALAARRQRLGGLRLGRRPGRHCLGLRRGRRKVHDPDTSGQRPAGR